MDTLTQLHNIIAYYEAMDLDKAALLDVIAIEGYKIGINAGKLAEKQATNEKFAKIIKELR